MASEQAKELRKQGIAAAKAGQKDQARQLLQQSLRLEPGSEVGWLWLASVARDKRERLICLQKLLEINPNNDMGLQSLQALGLTREQLAQQVRLYSIQPGEKKADTPRPDSGPVVSPASYLPVTEAQSPSKPPVVVAPKVSKQEAAVLESVIPAAQLPTTPIADQKKLADLGSEIDAIVRDYLAPAEGYPGVKWTQKSRGRAGERDVIYLRAWVGAGVAIILIVLLIGGWNVILNTPSLRGIVFAPSRTPTRTRPPPTATYTPTAGVTPTASETPALTLTPSATVPAEIPNGALNPPKPTEVYPPVFERPVRDSVNLIDRGEYELALPTLVVEVTLVSNSFDPAPYYYEALALAGKGDIEGGRQILQDAERRLPEKPNENYAPLVNAGLAYMDLLTAEKAVGEGDRSQLDTLVTNIEDRILPTMDADPRLALSYITLAEAYRLQNAYDRALGVLDRGLTVPELAANVNLIMVKAEVYFDQKEYDLADYQAFLALYIDPTTESAHLLQIHSALEQQNPGLAVLRSQAYLFYYPGSVEGYKLLGDARVMEGNTDLALEAYSQALAGGDNAEILAARAALYDSEHRYELERDDLSKALALGDDPQLRARRMLAAYQAGKLAIAQSDAAELLGKGVISDSEIHLLQARILIDQANGKEDYQKGLDLLNSLGSGLSSDLRPTADEYRANALYNLGTYDQALSAVNSALAASETGTAHYLRGLILEAQDKPEDALKEYDWVLTWGELYAYKFLPDVQERVTKLQAKPES